MQNADNKEETVGCIDCITGKPEKISFLNGAVVGRMQEAISTRPLPFVGAGLIDLQVNGINGIDFNNPALTAEDVIKATYYLLSQGVTIYLPTVITNSDENICKIISTIHEACKSSEVVDKCIWGIHLEGPFLSALEGARGAHDEKYIKPPDWELFQRFRDAAPGKIKLVTISPEWEAAFSFIEKCREHKIIVSIGHTMAGPANITRAVKAGASACTHLGNAVPLMLPRHPNIIWDLLSQDELYTCIIADGIHIPDAFIKVVMKCKGNKTLLVSDSTCFAGMPPGEYRNHIGGTVVLDSEKRVALKGSPGLLAGAGKTLLENVETLIEHRLASLAEAWQMASGNVAGMLVEHDDDFRCENDFVLFELAGNTVYVKKVIKDGAVVFEQ